MEKDSIFARHMRVLEKWAASDEPITFERVAALKCNSAGENTDDPVVQVLRSDWGRQNRARAARMTAAIEWVDRVDTLGLLLRSDLGRLNPERACELALKGSKLSAADALNWGDYDPPPEELEEAHR